VALTAPWLAIVAGVAGLVTKIKLEVVRKEAPAEDEAPAPSPTEEPKGPDQTV
jgi:hypothetical protein